LSDDDDRIRGGVYFPNRGETVALYRERTKDTIWLRWVIERDGHSAFAEYLINA